MECNDCIHAQNELDFEINTFSIPERSIVEQISGKIWHNRGFNYKKVKTSKIVHLDLLSKIGYGPIA